MTYVKVGGGFVLVDDAGVPRGIVLTFRHTPTPEPGTVVLLAAGLAGVAGLVRRRQAAA